MTDLQAMLIEQEGKRLIPYLDILGNWTVGVGHLLRPDRFCNVLGRMIDDSGITESECLSLLNDDIANALDDVNHCCSCYDDLSRPRQLALVSMAFNMGRDRLMKFVHFLNAIHKQDYDEAADEMLDSIWAKQVGIRATTLAMMMRDNVSRLI